MANEYDELIAPAAKPVDDYQPIVQSTMDDQKSALQSSMFVASKTEPDRAAAVQSLAQKTNLPPDVVDRNYDDVKQKHEVASTDYDAYVKDAPKSAEWLSNTNNASIAKDDIHGLADTEQTLSLYNWLKSTYNGIGIGVSTVMSGVAQTPALIAAAGNVQTNAMNKLLGIDRVNKVPDWLLHNPISNYYDAQSQSLHTPEMDGSWSSAANASDTLVAIAKGDLSGVMSAVGKANYALAGQRLFIQAGINSPNMLALAAMAYFGAPVGATSAAMGATTGAQSFGQDTTAHPELDQDTVAIGAGLKGFAEAGGEAIGPLGLFKHWEGEIFKSFGKQASSSVMKAFAKTLAYSWAGESTEEGLTQGAQDLTDYLTGVNPNLTPKQFFGNMLEAAGVGGFMGVGMTGPMALGAAKMRYHEARQAQLAKDIYTTTGDKVKESVLRARSPEAFESHFNAVTQGTGTENIAIDPKAIDTYFQGQKLNPVEEMHKLGVLDEYTNAKESGADIVIPYSKWINNTVDTPHYNGLADDVKFLQPENTHGQSMSTNEANANVEETKAQIEQTKKEAESGESPASSAGEVEQQIAKQLTDAGHDPRSAAIYAGVFNSLGTRLGQDPAQLFNQYKAEVQAADTVQSSETSLNQDEKSVGGQSTAGVRQGSDGREDTTNGRRPGQEEDGRALSSDTAPLEGLPAGSSPNSAIRAAAYEHAKQLGLPAERATKYVKADEKRGAKIAKAFDELKHEPNSPKVKKAYAALIKETVAQYQAVKKLGIKIEAIEPGMPNPYPEGSKQMFQDIKNGHLWFFPTEQGFGTVNKTAAHPLLAPTKEKIGDRVLLANDVFRIVHDVFGHAKEGNGFGPNGEENAWQAHVRMFSPLAARAMTTETRGQNSWVNFGPFGEKNRSDAKNTVYADQKAGLLPDWVSTEGLESGKIYDQSPQNALGFYSKLERTIEEKMGNSATVEQVQGLLRDMKPEERKWSGIDDFLKGKEKVSKPELLEFLAANQLQIQEVTKGKGVQQFYVEERRDGTWGVFNRDGELVQGHLADEDTAKNTLEEEYPVSAQSSTKYSQYTLPGGENYREVLFTLPPRTSNEQFPFTVEKHPKYDTWNVKWEKGGVEGGFASEQLATLHGIHQSKTTQEALAENYTSGHWDESNVLAHVRLNDRTDADGKKVLFVEEIQSDLHQEGRKKGYKTDASEADVKEWETLSGKMARDEATPADETRWKELGGENPPGTGVPDLPFRKTWQDFALKRIIRMAAEGGYDKVAWTTGEQQAERYNLGKSVEEIEYFKNAKGEIKVNVFGKDGDVVHSEQYKTPEDIAPVLGKDIAKKISETASVERQTISGDGLKIGGEGMKGFYDKILVDAANKLGKKFGAKVENSSIGGTEHYVVTEDGPGFFVRENNEEGRALGNPYSNRKAAEKFAAQLNSESNESEVHSMDITPELKKAAIDEGFPLFQDGGQGPRGQIHLMDRSAIIKLSKSADPSTLFHESGHYFLEVLGKAAALPDAPKQIKDDYATLREWMGAKEGEALSVENHEQFARGFEAYIMEGKAPSNALKAPFTRFRIWLTSVYKNLKALNVELTPEVRGVMDRLLATDEEIAQAKQVQNYAPLFADPSKFGLTGDKAVRYQKAVDDAKEAAENELTRRVMAEYTREQTAAWKEQRGKLKEAIAQGVNKMPVYIADSIMRRGVLPDGSPLPPGVSQIKLDYASTPADIRRTVPRGTMTKDGTGVHPDIAASLFGFQSGTELIQALSTAEPREALINRMADEQMKAEHGDMMTDGTMPAEAMKAIHNDKQAELMRLELEHLASNNMPVLKDTIRQVARRVPTNKQVKQHAQATIGGETVGQIKPSIYERAGAKMAKLAGEALAKGDFQAAYEAKLKELFNHELYKAAIAAQEDVEKSLTRFKKITRGDNEKIAKTRDMDLVNTARAVLTQFGIGKADADADSFLKPMRQYDPDTYETMKSLVDSATKNTGPYKNVSYNDFADMRDTVNALWDLARTTREIEVDGKKMDREKAIAELGEAISARMSHGQKDGYTRSASKWDMTKMYLMGARAAVRRIESWVDSMDAGDRNGAFRRIFFNPIIQGTTQYRVAKIEYTKKYSDLLNTISPTLTNTKIRSPELKHVFADKAQLLGAFLHYGNESNFQKLLRGYNWGTVDSEGNLDSSKWDTFMDRMYKEGIITKADVEFAQSVWNLMEELKPGAQAAHKAMYGHYFNEITARPVVTPFGTYRGGYVPAKVDQFKAPDAATRADKESLTGTQNSFAFPTSGRGATKSRVEAYAAPLQFDLRFVAQHVDWALRFAHIEPHVKTAARILFNKNFQNQLNALDPTISGDALVPWLQRTAKQSIAGNTQGWGGKGMDKFLNGVRSRVGMNIMVANFTNAFQQVTGLSISALRVPPSHLRDALVTYIKSPRKTTDSVNEMSDFMRTRTTSQLFEIRKNIDDLLLDPSKYEKAADFIKKHGYVLASSTQNMVDIITWTGAYDHALQSGMEGKQAIMQADSAVRMTQGSFNPEDISRFETGTPFHRLFTMFSGYFNMAANLDGTEFANTWRDMGLRKGAGRMLYIYALGFMIPGMLSEAITKAMSGKLDDDDDGSYVNDFLNVFFGGQLKMATAMVPGLGPIINAGINRMNDKAYDDSIMVSPAISAIESGLSAVVPSTHNSVYKALAEGGSKKKATRDALTAIGFLSGLPVAPLAKPAGYLLDYSEGIARPSGPIDFARGLVTGKPGASR